MQGRNHAVDQYQYWLVATAFIAVMQVEAVQLDVARAALGTAIARFQAFER
ncbi:hypothetical protein D9M69_726920 [compost metagenome]